MLRLREGGLAHVDRARSDVMAELAAGTGASLFQNNNDLDAGFARLASAPEYYYLLAFSPQNLKMDGGFHALKVTLKNGDVFYYYLDPDTFIEIQVERQTLVRGSVRESMTWLGSYKPVNGVMFPFSIEVGAKNNPNRGKITITRIEANVPIDDGVFKMPGAANAPAAAK